MEQGEIVLYQPDEEVKLEVRLEDETAWLVQVQMAALFDVKEHIITYHIKEIYNTGELDINPTTRKIRVVRKKGNRNVAYNIDFYNIDFYNIDMILSAGDSNVNRIKTRFKRFMLDEKPFPIVKLTVNKEIDNNYQNIQLDCLKLLHDLCGRGV